MTGAAMSVMTGATHGAGAVGHGGTVSAAEHAAQKCRTGNGGCSVGIVRRTVSGGSLVKRGTAYRTEIGDVIDLGAAVFAKCHVDSSFLLILSLFYHVQRRMQAFQRIFTHCFRNLHKRELWDKKHDIPGGVICPAACGIIFAE